MKSIQPYLARTGAVMDPTSLNRAQVASKRVLDDVVARRLVLSSTTARFHQLDETDASAYRELKIKPPFEAPLRALRVYVNLNSFTGASLELTISATGIEGWKDLVLSNADLPTGVDLVKGVFRDMRIPAGQEVVITFAVATATAWQFDRLDVEFELAVDRHQGSPPDGLSLKVQKSGASQPTDIADFDTELAADVADDDTAANKRLVRIEVIDIFKCLTGTAAHEHPLMPSTEGMELHSWDAYSYCSGSQVDFEIRNAAGAVQDSVSIAAGASLASDQGRALSFTITGDEDDFTARYELEISSTLVVTVERAYAVLYWVG